MSKPFTYMGPKLRDSEKKHYSSTIYCTRCGKIVGGISGLKYHMSVAHTNSRSKQQPTTTYPVHRHFRARITSNASTDWPEKMNLLEDVYELASSEVGHLIGVEVAIKMISLVKLKSGKILTLTEALCFLETLG